VRVAAARLQATERRLKLAHPGVRLQQQMQRLDDLSQRLGGAARARVHHERLRVSELKTRLARRSPQHAVQEYRARHQQLQTRLTRACEQTLAHVAHRLALAQRGLHSVSPLATLTRGFAIITRADGRVLTDAAAVDPGEEIEARLARGILSARVTGRK
jgi:exodeoxyribonuclease VII large subunit